MSFIPITTGEIATGKPVSTSTAQKIKENFEDHESRLDVMETGVGTTYPPMIFRINGPYGMYGAKTDVVRSTANFPITISGVRILIDKAGISGITEIDIKYKRGVGAWTSILTTLPSVPSSDGDDATSTNAILNAGEANLQAGDLIRLDLTSIQANGIGFTVRIDYSRTP